MDRDCLPVVSRIGCPINLFTKQTSSDGLEISRTGLHPLRCDSEDKVEGNNKRVCAFMSLFGHWVQQRSIAALAQGCTPLYYRYFSLDCNRPLGCQLPLVVILHILWSPWLLRIFLFYPRSASLPLSSRRLRFQAHRLVFFTLIFCFLCSQARRLHFFAPNHYFLRSLVLFLHFLHAQSQRLTWQVSGTS